MIAIQSHNPIRIFTDGAGLGNPSPGGYGAITLLDDVGYAASPGGRSPRR